MAAASRFRRRFPRLTMLWGLGVILLGGCSNEECLDNRNAIPYMGFWSSSKRDTEMTLDSTAIYPILHGKHLSMLLDSTASAKYIPLPMDLEADTTTFVFEYSRKELLKAGITDTLRVNYSRTPYFTSAACGVCYRILVSEVSYTHNVIETVEIPFPLVTNQARRTFNIYFHTSKPSEEEESQTGQILSRP